MMKRLHDPRRPLVHDPRPVGVRTVLGVLLLIGSMLGATEAGAQRTSVVWVNGRMTVSASPGVANQIFVSENGGRLVVSDVVSMSESSTACTLAANEVRCTKPTSLKIKVKDGDDVVISLSDVPTDVRGGPGDDTILTANGNDKASGGGGSDFIATGAGKDILRGNGGGDHLDGGPGPRVGTDSDVIIGGPGFDVVSFARRRNWPTMTNDRIANDGEVNEMDNVKTVEAAEKRPFNFENDSSIVPPSGSALLARVWSGSESRFGIATSPERNLQVIGYYNEAGVMTIAARRLGEWAWQTTQLPTDFPKPRDGHRDIALIFDREGLLHVAGNMHGSPRLQYFRSSGPMVQPTDVSSISPATMIGDANESSPTYPVFLLDQVGTLRFLYRQGSTDQGDYYVTEWNSATRSWARINGGIPIFNGFGNRSPGDQSGAYFRMLEHEGTTHLLWYIKWRDPNRCNPITPIPPDFPQYHCQLSYMRTTDWKKFYDVTGQQIQLPITPERLASPLVVDPARSGGLFWLSMALDASGRPLIMYVRNYGGFGADPAGGYLSIPEVYLARFNGSSWSTRQLTSWERAFPMNAYPTTFTTITGPHVDSSGIPEWFARAALIDPDRGNVSTSWYELDPATLQTSALSGEPALPRPCATGNNTTPALFAPVEFPGYVDPKSGVPFASMVTRSDMRSGTGAPEEFDPQLNDAQDYYYLRWEMIDRGSQETDPAVPGDPEPNATRLTLHRTSCLK